ncbi:unnamed protein product [Paramecium primaurelia]|uniref:Steroid 5-alpha reductase C-terminal domain-containing protein n=1 Tax=Paramecium primaurelia TaxID=5886 RepID=A0A8S1L320_PARPR|nr:unnamed protein product [Paramecium primaurelia]
MVYFVDVALIWALPAILINKLIFYLVYKIGGNHECIVDVAYSISHLVAGVVYFIFSTISTPAKIINILLVALWSLRLGGFLCVTRVLVGFKDERYDNIFSEYNADKFKKDLMVFVQFMFQGLIVFVTSIPLYFLFLNDLTWQSDNFKGLNVMNYIALSIIPFSIFLEATADLQLEKFKKQKQQGLIAREDLMETGLWRKSRHPNLFFDLVTWFCFALAAINDAISLCAFIGPIALFCVMEFLTTPLTEAHMKKKRGDIYAQYVARTNKYLVM